jgi:hypothetical protein
MRFLSAVELLSRTLNAIVDEPPVDNQRSIELRGTRKNDLSGDANPRKNRVQPKVSLCHRTIFYSSLALI